MAKLARNPKAFGIVGASVIVMVISAHVGGVLPSGLLTAAGISPWLSRDRVGNLKQPIDHLRESSRGGRIDNSRSNDN
jgi:hypothetical protein